MTSFVSMIATLIKEHLQIYKIANDGFLRIFSAEIGSPGLEGKNLDNPEKSEGLVSMHLYI